MNDISFIFYLLLSDGYVDGYANARMGFKFIIRGTLISGMYGWMMVVWGLVW